MNGLSFIDETENFSNKREYASNDPSLLKIFAEISGAGYSFREFILAALQSANSEVRRHVGMFYSHGGPAIILEHWNRNLRRTRYDASFVQAAVELVVNRTRSELNTLSEQESLRFPFNSVSRQSVEAFSMDHIDDVFITKAPHLTLLLQGLAISKADRDEGIPPHVAVIGSQLLHSYSQKSNYLQMVMGLYFHTSGCPKRVLSVLAAADLSVSYDTVMNALTHLTETAIEELRTVIYQQPFFILFDNINFPNRKYDQRVHNKDTFENGATATIVLGGDLGTTISTGDPITPLNINHLTPDARNRTYLRIAFRYQLFNVLRRHYDTYDRCSIRVPPSSLLHNVQSATFLLPSMKIDQSTVEGNIEILMTIIKRVLQLPESWFHDCTRIIVAGDQLTVARVAAAKILRSRDNTPLERLQWATPVIQLFHLQMLLCNTILRTHFGSKATPGSVAFFNTLLDRRRLTLDSPNYHAADEILRHVFDGMVLRLWQVELGTEQLEPLGRRLDRHELHNLISTHLDSINNLYLVNSKQLTDTVGNANVNAALFLRDMMIYLDLCDAIRAGDVGRLEETLLIITVMFQAGGIKNYANELLRLTYGMRYAWSDPQKKAIMSSWLINSKGRANEWIPADLFQEHNNLLIKTIHSAKGSNMSWETLANKISTNVRLFSKIGSLVEGEFHIPHNSPFHSTVSTYSDITKIVEALKNYDILGNNPHPHNLNVPLVRDLVKEGFEKFPERFDRFVESMRLGHYNEQSNTSDDILDDDAIAESIERESLMAEEYINSSLNS